MAALLVAIAVMGILMTAAMPVWRQQAQREKEAELVFRGEQWARAIGLFQRKFAGAFPPNMKVLVEQKFIRKAYKDPITNDEFEPIFQGRAGATPGEVDPPDEEPSTPPVPQPGRAGGRGRAGAPTSVGSSVTGTPGAAGGIIGFRSKSFDSSIRIYKGRTNYSDWLFVYTEVSQQPGGAGSPQPGMVPGRRGGGSQLPGMTPGVTPGMPPGGPRGGRGPGSFPPPPGGPGRGRTGGTYPPAQP